MSQALAGSARVAKSDKIDAAVRACLDHSRRSPDQAAAMKKFLDHLRASALWSEAEVAEVENKLRRILLPDAGASAPADEQS